MSIGNNLFKITIAFIIAALYRCQTFYQDVFNKGPACMNGRLQSPIDLSDENSKYSQEDILTSINYFSFPNLFLNFNEKGILQVYQSSVNSAVLGTVNYKKRGYLSQFELINIEIYYPAEHRIKIGGSLVSPDVEIKLIHKKNKLFSSSVNQLRNFTEPNSYLIVSLLYKQNATTSDNGFLTDLNILYNPTKSAMIMKNIDLGNYGLIKNHKYYMYDGSFSSYPCDENVSYVVVQNLFSISSNDVENIKSKYSTKWANGQVNKQISSIYGRPVYRNFITSTSNFIKENFIFALALILLILF